jgi:hypothetical protein
LFIIQKFGYKGGARFSARDIGTVAVENSGNVILDGVLLQIQKLDNWVWTN